MHDPVSHRAALRPEEQSGAAVLVEGRDGDGARALIVSEHLRRSFPFGGTQDVDGRSDNARQSFPGSW